MPFRFLQFLFHRPDPTPEPTPPSIFDIAAGNDSFNILTAALEAANLKDLFSGPGDFTVFAPTDAAFIDLAQSTLGIAVDGRDEIDIAVDIVTALGPERLLAVLNYHVQVGADTQAELTKAGTVTTAGGGTFDIAGNVLIDADPNGKNPEFIDGLTDIEASNGVIQAIDQVLLPIEVTPEGTFPTIVDTAIGAGAFTILVEAVIRADLAGVLSNPDADFTVFAPTDDAFNALVGTLGLSPADSSPAAIVDALVDALTLEGLTDVLLYHVAPESRSVSDLQDDQGIQTASGGVLGVKGNKVVDAAPGLPSAKFVDGLTDLEVLNGTIQTIDSVLIPLDVLDVGNLRKFGTFRDDIFQGGNGNDRFWGSFGDDLLVGNNGNDKLNGGFGDDQLFGGAGNDHVRGNIGNDLLVDGAGNDHYWGGIGADMFDFTAASGIDHVRDLRSNDTLMLSHETFASADDVLDAATREGRNTVIEQDDFTIVLRGVRHFDENDFILV